jgi:hypothetical protein
MIKEVEKVTTSRNSYTEAQENLRDRYRELEETGELPGPLKGDIDD